MQPPPVSCQTHTLSDGTTLYYTGPSLDEGPLPAFWYFSLAGDESLCLDPFNQVVAFLQGEGVRCFSLTLPFHSEGFDKRVALNHWAEEIASGGRAIHDFLDTATRAIEEMAPAITSLATGGLSRGALVALHLAARLPQITHLVGFAPVTSLAATQHFSPIIDSPHIHDLLLEPHIPTLTRCHIRFYIGNRDIAVDTEACFAFAQQIVAAAYDQGKRSAQVDFMMRPSIGHRGHGTPTEVFHEASRWLLSSF